MKVTSAFTSQRAPVTHWTLAAVPAVLWLSSSETSFRSAPGGPALTFLLLHSTARSKPCIPCARFCPLYCRRDCLGRWTNLLDGVERKWRAQMAF